MHFRSATTFVALILLSGFAVHAQSAPMDQSNPGTPPAEASAPTDATKADKSSQPPKKQYDPRDLCITEQDAPSELLNKRRQIGGRITMDTFLLPTGGNVEVGLDESF